MSPQVKKEIRLLLPAWVLAMVLAIIHALFFSAIGPGSRTVDISGQAPVLILGQLFVLGFLLLGITCFGQEFGSGSFTLMLSQPVERRRIWAIKTFVLGVAFASILVLWAALVAILYFLANTSVPWPKLGFVLVWTITIFSGGLWTTLLLRQMVSAFWFTLLIPLLIGGGLNALCESFNFSNSTAEMAVAGVLLLYSLAGFLFARWLFLRAQDAQWTGGEVSFSWFRKSTTTRPMPVSLRPRRRISALIWKEIHLHQANFLIATFILVLHLSAVLVLKIHPHFDNPDVQFIFENFWILWLLMPFLIGATTIAEERRLGVMESQLCMAVSRHMQLLVKFVIGLVLSLSLGGAIPLLIEGTMKLGYGIFIFAAIIFFVAFYASSAARTTLQAMGLAMACALTIFGYETATAGFIVVRNYYQFQGGLELLKLYLGIPILVLIFCGLISWNFKWLHADRKLWSRNAIAIIAGFASIFILTNAIYFRVWEFVLPSGPRGPIRLNQSNQIQFAGQNSDLLYTTLPDGRLWAATLDFDEISNRWWRSTVIDQCRGKFIGGSNWVEVTADRFQAVAIQSNGTLWAVQNKWGSGPGKSKTTGPFTLTHIGSDTDWAQAAGGSMGFLLLKKDGSLWVWGTREFQWPKPHSIPMKFKSDFASPPVRLGDDHDWEKVIPSSTLALAQKADGSRWTWGWRSGTGTNRVLTVVQETNPYSQWSNFAFLDNGSFVGVKTNGQLWLYSPIYSRQRTIIKGFTKTKLGAASKWRVAVGKWDSILAIREDGTLWKWQRQWSQHDVFPGKPVQVGSHSDWISLTGGWMGTIALASDGSLWAWDQPSGHVWLAPPRRLAYLGNIFQDTAANR